MKRIVRPSQLPGSKFMEELLVKMSSLVLVQLASPTPTVTSDMQVHIVIFFLKHFLVSPVDRIPEIVPYDH